MGLADTKLAIDHAYKAFATWGKTTEYERAAILNKLFKCVGILLWYTVNVLTGDVRCRLLTDAKEDLAQVSWSDCECRS